MRSLINLIQEHSKYLLFHYQRVVFIIVQIGSVTSISHIKLESAMKKVLNPNSSFGVFHRRGLAEYSDKNDGLYLSDQLNGGVV
jgi:hypothetical protein